VCSVVIVMQLVVVLQLADGVTTRTSIAVVVGVETHQAVKMERALIPTTVRTTIAHRMLLPIPSRIAVVSTLARLSTPIRRTLLLVLNLTRVPWSREEADRSRPVVVLLVKITVSLLVLSSTTVVV
jgi:hypothetical protein